MDLYAKLSAQMEEVASSINKRMAKHEEELKMAMGTETPHKTISSLSREFVDFKTFVCETLKALSMQMNLLVSGLDRHEMASRRKVLLLHGVPEKDDPLSSVIHILTDKIELSEVTRSDIAVCHRLGTNNTKPRPVLVRFHQHSVRDEAWKAKTKLKGSGLTITEFLTKPRHRVFMEARRHYGTKQAWTSDGKINIQLPDRSRRKIETAAELRELISQFPATQMASETSSQPAQRPAPAQHSGKATNSSTTRSRRPLK